MRSLHFKLTGISALQLSLLPALPAAWSEGNAFVLRARGDYTLKWHHGQVLEASILAAKTGLCRVRICNAIQA
ncbi:glycoside hydrolase family 95-like protein [Paenibacillus sp. GCM10027628]|uniref:glycoside hydrolase family 95-like protein n=1 Tax=Paenibacillus sp. GCM10027628 TaxID=3273413 RepID=UPI0036405D5F